MIRARLSDAKFFYETDLKTKLEDRLPKFEHIVFHEKLGTQAERIERIETLAADSWRRWSSADVAKAERAAKLAKADLADRSGRRIPRSAGPDGQILRRGAGRGRSRRRAPSRITTSRKGPDDCVPTDPVSVAVALADKIDMLAGFWAIDEKPTGSKDPYRAAAGGARRDPDNLEQQYPRPLVERILAATTIYRRQSNANVIAGIDKSIAEARKRTRCARTVALLRMLSASDLRFFADRLKVQLREQGARHDLVDAVFALEGQDDLLLIVRRVEALGKFLDTDDGKNLLAGTKRAANILRIEEKKDSKSYTGAPDAALYQQAEEKALAARHRALPRRKPPRRSPRRISPPP